MSFATSHDGCKLPITTAEIEHELDFADKLLVRFHAGCAATWRSLVANCNTRSEQ